MSDKMKHVTLEELIHETMKKSKQTQELIIKRKELAASLESLVGSVVTYKVSALYIRCLVKRCEYDPWGSARSLVITPLAGNGELIVSESDICE